MKKLALIFLLFLCAASPYQDEAKIVTLGPTVRVDVSAPNNIPPIAGSVAGITGGSAILGSENLFTYSEEFGNAAWNPTNVSFNSNIIASPYTGANTADLITATGTGVNAYIYEVLNFVSGDYYTCSVTVKATGAPYASLRLFDGSAIRWAYIDLLGTDAGTLSDVDSGLTTKVSPLTNLWFEFEITAASSNTGAGNCLFGPASVSGTPQVTDTNHKLIAARAYARRTGMSRAIYSTTTTTAVSTTAFLQATAANRPTFTTLWAGRKGLYFDNTDVLGSTKTLADAVGASAKTVFAVGYLNSAEAATWQMFGDSGSNFTIGGNAATPSVLVTNTDAGGADTLTFSSSGWTVPFLTTVRHDGTNLEAWLNYRKTSTTPGRSYATVASGATTTTTGTLNLGSGLNGNIQELIVFNKVLPAQNMQEICEYLNLKWGLSTHCRF